jgi:NADPH:quinone reductase-like Zn-dependent oxidoreductase
MRAIVQRRYGDDPERVLRVDEIAAPKPGGDDVLVRVVAASVDMGTWHCMSGIPYGMRLMGFGVRSPRASNPGRAFAGTVESTGKLVGFGVGDAVYGTCDGAFAELVRVEPTKLAAKPRSCRSSRPRRHPSRASPHCKRSAKHTWSPVNGCS